MKFMKQDVGPIVTKKALCNNKKSNLDQSFQLRLWTEVCAITPLILDIENSLTHQVAT